MASAYLDEILKSLNNTEDKGEEVKPQEDKPEDQEKHEQGHEEAQKDGHFSDEFLRTYGE